MAHMTVINNLRIFDVHNFEPYSFSLPRPMLVCEVLVAFAPEPEKEVGWALNMNII